MAQLRADARRNRAQILRAAGELLENAPSPADVSMDAIAARAGVGKGTLFRRFGDRDSLIRAIIADRTAPLRDAIASGPPPLGPATPPRDRILAILDAVVLSKIDSLALSLAHEQPGASNPYLAPHYTWAHTLITELLTDLGWHTDEAFAAHALLAMTRADLIVHLVHDARLDPAQIRVRLHETATRLLDK